jgi:hypothetical protein
MLLEGKKATPLEPRAAEDQGLAPCHLCDPVVAAGA